jgi:hypothetical protein
LTGSKYWRIAGPARFKRRDNEGVRGFCIGLMLFALWPLSASEPQATIIDSGSTNRSGMRVTVDAQGHATVVEKSGETHHVNLSQPISSDFLHDVIGAVPLSHIPVHHCFKSVSFGSSLFIEYQGERSPDLSCPGPTNTDTASLVKEAHILLEAAQKAAGIRQQRRVFTTVPPH